MFFMICYDIIDDARRRKMQKLLEGYGEGVQYSVFECDISDSQYRDLKGKVFSSIKRDEDNVRFYPLCRACAGKIEFTGNGAIMENEHFFII
ncbi:MAG: CRISPR-associated endonuclease Cas2 [Nitrospirota bacterium]